MNILEEVQTYIADKLNADPQLSACPFLVENRRDIDFEIKQALGKQGIVGLVMTPRATYAGAYMDAGIAWQIDALEIDVVENVTVNRGKKNGYITGQDAAMRLFDVLCPLSGDHEGQFNPVSYEEGEDNSLLVNKAVLKCLVHKTLIPTKTIVQFADGTSRTYDIKGPLELNWLGVGVYPGDVVDVQIGEEVTGLGERSFTGFGSLSSIVVPKNVTSISGEAFSYTGLRDVVIENGVTELGYGVFSYSNSLSSVTLPNTLKKIGADVFEECYGLSSISVPKSVVDISRVAFRYSRLSAVTMEGRTKAETKAIANYPWSLSNGSVVHCTDGDILVNGETVVKYTDGRSVELDIQGGLSSDSIPDREYIFELDIGNAVTSIGENAFDRCDDLETVIIPESVETIGTMGFSRTRRLTSVTIEGNGLKVIGDGAFAAATALSSISLPDSVVSIGRSAFEDCVLLTSIDIPASVQTMDREVFLGCGELMNVTFSGKTKATVKGMDNYSWALPPGCVVHCADGDFAVGLDTKATYRNGDVVEYGIQGELSRGQISSLADLVSLEIGHAVTGIAASAFSGCASLSSVQIPDSVAKIGVTAFKDCYSLATVFIPDSVSSVGGSAFQGCTGLLDASLGGGLSAVPSGMFSGCVSLSSMILPENIAAVDGGAFYNCTGLRSINIPGSVSSLNTGAFRNCSGLTSVYMPSGLKVIQNYVFGRCSGLNAVVIPEGVTYIGVDAFIGCTGIADVYCWPNPADLEWDDADKDDFKTDGSTICHVRPQYLAAYQAKFVNVTFVGDLT